MADTKIQSIFLVLIVVEMTRLAANKACTAWFGWKLPVAPIPIPPPHDNVMAESLADTTKALASVNLQLSLSPPFSPPELEISFEIIPVNKVDSEGKNVR